MKTDIIKSSGFHYYLEQLDSFLSRNLGRQYIQTPDEKAAVKQWRSVQFNYKGIVDVDLLVSPHWRDQYDLYRFLESVDNPSK